MKSKLNQEEMWTESISSRQPENNAQHAFGQKDHQGQRTKPWVKQIVKGPCIPFVNIASAGVIVIISSLPLALALSLNWLEELGQSAERANK